MTKDPELVWSNPTTLRRLALTAAFSALALTGCSDAGTGAVQSSVKEGAIEGTEHAVSTQVEPVTGTVASVIAPNREGREGSEGSEGSAEAQTYSDAWGPQTGSQIPMLAATDHAGQAQTLESLSGDKGLLLVFSRSADW